MKLFMATRPLESVGIDILGPLPKSKSGHRFIVVITDRFSKLTQIVAVKRIRAWDIAVAFVDEWVFKYGPPQTLVSDNRSLFPSSSSVCAIYWASLTRSPPRIIRKRMGRQSDSIVL